MDVDIDVLHGDEISSYLGSVARLRIEIFRAFPYLYDGDLEYERTYLQQYAQSENCIFVIARDADGQVVGASTGVRIDDADAEFRRPFEGQDLTQIFYFGESVLEPEFRGQGIGHAFFDEREKFARGIGCSTCTFCAVNRPPNHPARPRDYAPLDPFWHKRGYIELGHIQTTYAWRDIGDEDESPKTMTYWVRQLAN